MAYEKVMENLRKNGFEVIWCDTADEAAQKIKDSLKDRKIVFGGSVTLQQLGLYELLGEKNKVFWHWKQDRSLMRQAEVEADVYMASVNGLSEEGYLINIDGAGNRVTNAVYGHDTVIYVAGVNKIGGTFNETVDRARNIASPENCRRLKRNTPCVEGGKCFDCSSEDRICNVMTVVWHKPTGIKNAIFYLVGETLGY